MKRITLAAGYMAALMMAAGNIAAAQAGNQQSSSTQQGPIAVSTEIAPNAPVTYDNKYEIFGGLSYMNFKAGTAVPQKMNMGGWEAQGTYWVTPMWGATVSGRGEYGTTPVLANPFGSNNPIYDLASRVLVYQHMGMAGVTRRGPKGRYAAIEYHALAGMSVGVFNAGTGLIQPQQIGLYTNSTSFVAALGGSVDFNQSAHFAIRLSPDLILNKFGSPVDEFFAISGGVIYRFGKR